MEGSGTILKSPFIQKIIMQHKIPLPSDLEGQKLNWLLQINDEYFEQQLKEVVSIFLIL